MNSNSDGVREFCESFTRIIEEYGECSRPYEVRAHRESSGQISISLIDRKAKEVLRQAITPPQCSQLSWGEWVLGATGTIVSGDQIFHELKQIEEGDLPTSVEAKTIARVFDAEPDKTVIKRIFSVLRRTSPFERVLDVLADPPDKGGYEEFLQLPSTSFTIVTSPADIPEAKQAEVTIATLVTSHLCKNASNGTVPKLDCTLRAIALAASESVVAPVERFIASQLEAPSGCRWDHAVERQIHFFEQIKIVQRVVSKIISKKEQVEVTPFEIKWSLETTLDSLGRPRKVDLTGDLLQDWKPVYDIPIHIVHELGRTWERSLIGEIQALFDRPDIHQVFDNAYQRAPNFRLERNTLLVGEQIISKDPMDSLGLVFDSFGVPKEAHHLFQDQRESFLNMLHDSPMGSYLVHVLLAATKLPFQPIVEFLKTRAGVDNVEVKDSVRIDIHEFETVVTQFAVVLGQMQTDVTVSLEIRVSKTGTMCHVFINAEPEFLFRSGFKDKAHNFLPPVPPQVQHEVVGEKPALPLLELPPGGIMVREGKIQTEEDLRTYFQFSKDKTVNGLITVLSSLPFVSFTSLVERARPAGHKEVWKHDTIIANIIEDKGTTHVCKRILSTLKRPGVDVWGASHTFDIASVRWELDIGFDASGTVIGSKVTCLSADGMPKHSPLWPWEGKKGVAWQRPVADQIEEYVRSSLENRSLKEDLVAHLDRTEIEVGEFFPVYDDITTLFRALHIDPNLSLEQPIAATNPLHPLCVIFGDAFSPLVKRIFGSQSLQNCLGLEEGAWEHTVERRRIHTLEGRGYEIVQKQKATCVQKGGHLFEIDWVLKGRFDSKGAAFISTSVERIEGGAVFSAVMGRAVLSELTSSWRREQKQQRQTYPLFDTWGTPFSFHSLHIKDRAPDATESAHDKSWLKAICEQYLDPAKIEPVYPLVQQMMRNKIGGDDAHAFCTFHDLRFSIFLDLHTVCFSVNSLLYDFAHQEKTSLMTICGAYEWNVTLSLNERAILTGVDISSVNGIEPPPAFLKKCLHELTAAYHIRPQTESFILRQ